MAEAHIPVDLTNPGQVFACLGFLEAADVLLGDAEGGFDWQQPSAVCFRLRAAGDRNPFEVVLEFLAGAIAHPIKPVGYVPKKPEKGDAEDGEEESEEESEEEGEDELLEGNEPSFSAINAANFSQVFPARSGETTSLPIRLQHPEFGDVVLSHWADGARESFKLYAGNRTAEKIANAMLRGTREKPKKDKKTQQQHTIGDLKTMGVSQLFAQDKTKLIKTPFDVLTPLSGSFNFDPRGGWTAIDAGYSPNKQKHRVQASPVVQILAAWGLEHARPVESDVRQVRYAVWSDMLQPMLGRIALQGSPTSFELQHFHFELALNGKNKAVNFAKLENHA